MIEPLNVGINEFELGRADAVRRLSEECTQVGIPPEQVRTLESALHELEEWRSKGISMMFKMVKGAGLSPQPSTIMAFIVSGLWRELGYNRVLDALINELHLDEAIALPWAHFAVEMGYDSIENYPEFTNQQGAA